MFTASPMIYLHYVVHIQNGMASFLKSNYCIVILATEFLWQIYISLRVQKLETNFVKTQMHKKVRMLSYKWIHPIVPYLTIAIYLAYVHDPALYFDIFSCSLGFSRFLSMMLFGKDVHTWSCWPPMKNKIKTRVLSYLSAISFHWVMKYLDLVSKIDLIVVLHFKPNVSIQGRTKWRKPRAGTGYVGRIFTA